jgi:hypothetical protein
MPPPDTLLLPLPARPIAAAGNKRPQATDPIVDFAVLHRKPFAVVPCCVFARQFTDRRTADGGRVTTYKQLLDYLQAKSPGIQRVRLPFSGANVLLYQTHYP